MRSSSLLIPAIIASAGASVLRPTSRSANPRVVSVDLERRWSDKPLASHRSRLSKRAGTVLETLDNEETLYFANITLGTPAQNIRLHIDTGSSDLWVNTVNSSLCSTADTCIGGTFNSDQSSTLKIVNNEFNISYVDGSGADGDYVTDTLGFGGVSLSDFQFGLGEVSASNEGVLGIGYVTNEVQVQRAGLASYPNLPQALVNGGLIERNAYSLWLNDLDASTGIILFGGVNTDKFTGSLGTVPIIEADGGFSELLIALTGVSLNGTALSSRSLPTAVLLDSGSTLSYLPDDIVATIYDKVGAVYDAQSGAAYAACSLANSGATIDFSFSGQQVSVGMDELLIDVSDEQQGGLGQQAQTCVFGIAPAGSTTAVLGDTFLRSAYVVYDLSNNQISLAQTVFNSTTDNVEEIPSGTALVPGATAVPSAVSTISGTATGAARLGGVTTSTVHAGGAPSRVTPPPQKQILAAGGLAVLAGAGFIAL